MVVNLKLKKQTPNKAKCCISIFIIFVSHCKLSYFQLFNKKNSVLFLPGEMVPDHWRSSVADVLILHISRGFACISSAPSLSCAAHLSSPPAISHFNSREKKASEELRNVVFFSFSLFHLHYCAVINVQICLNH